MTTELKDRLRVINGLPRLRQGIEVHRRAAIEAVRIARENIVLVQALGGIHDRRRSGRGLGQAAEQEADHVPPRLEVELLEEGLHGFLRRLLRRERRPLEVLVLGGVSSVPQAVSY